MTLGDALTRRATHAPHRARILGLGLSVGIAIALAGCDAGRPIAAFECVEAHPGWRTPERFTFASTSDDPYPTGCKYVTDTEGWERKMCESGPDQYICRATTASAMSTGTAKTPKAVEGRSPASAVAKPDAQPQSGNHHD